MKRVYCWPFLIMIGLTPVQSANADDDDYLEQIEDATGEPLQTDMSHYVDRKFPPMRLTAKEEIEWGEFNNTDVTTFRTTATGEISFPITKKYFAGVSTSVGTTNTNFSGDSHFIDSGKSSGDPWNDLYEFSLRFRSHYLINDRWGVMLASWMVSRYEDGAKFDDGLKGAGATAITYSFGDKFNIVGGVAVASRIVGGGVSVNPFGQFSWNIDERHTLSTSGVGLRLRSKWNKSITTHIYAQYKGRRWRLDDRNDGLVNRGSLRDRRVPIGVGLQWKFLKGWRMRGDLGLIAYRQLKTTDDDGDSFDTVTSDAPGVFGSLLLQTRF
jgi:hypothetical protein